MNVDDLLDLDAIAERVSRLLADSPADLTEVVWLESRAAQVAEGGRQRAGASTLARTVTVRVEERGRSGLCRTGGGEPGELADAVRHALAAARLDPGPPLPRPAAQPIEPARFAELRDPEVAALEPEAARARVARGLERRETAQLDWTEGHLMVADSRGLVRRASVTALSYAVRCGRRPGSGSAATAARSLARLDPLQVLERARARHGGSAIEELPENGAPPVVLSAEASCRLLELALSPVFSGRGYDEGRSYLSGRLGQPVFSSKLDVTDDPSALDGLPFPFDLEGSAKSPTALMRQGRPLTPALDLALAARLGLPPTAHALGDGEALPSHPRLVPSTEPATIAGSAHRGEPEAELCRRAAGGIWIGALERAECYAPRTLAARLFARGVRRIGPDGALAGALPDLVWDGSLEALLAAVTGVGSETACRAIGNGWLGGAVAPALLVGALPDLRPVLE